MTLKSLRLSVPILLYTKIIGSLLLKIFSLRERERWTLTFGDIWGFWWFLISQKKSLKTPFKITPYILMGKMMCFVSFYWIVLRYCFTYSFGVCDSKCMLISTSQKVHISRLLKVSLAPDNTQSGLLDGIFYTCVIFTIMHCHAVVIESLLLSND